MDLNKICNQVIKVSKETGQFLLKECVNFDRQHIEFKGLNDMVSYVDKQAEKTIVEKLSLILPDAGFIAEEGTGERKESGYNWIIDPLDGTTNFIHGVPLFSVSIALLKDDELQVGVIYEPNLDECFYATKGGKAYLNGKLIQISPEKNLARALVATGFPYTGFEKLAQYMKVMEDLMQKSHGIRRIGSAAVDLAYVACGRFDAFFEYNLKAWDVAAGILIVKEAGGIVTDFTGGNDCIFGREVVAAGHIQNELREVIHNRLYS